MKAKIKIVITTFLMCVYAAVFAQSKEDVQTEKEGKKEGNESLMLKKNTRSFTNVELRNGEVKNFSSEDPIFFLEEYGKENKVMEFVDSVFTHSGDIYKGFTRNIPFRQVIPPHGLEVTLEKTVHILFPAPISYVDLGNEDIMAAVVGEATNVLRVKAAYANFEKETNLSVITASGSFYSFNVKYVDEPDRLNIEMQDFLSDGSAFNRPNNAMEIYLQELNGESPRLVNLIMKAIYDAQTRFIRHIGSKNFKIQYTLNGIYSYGGMLYFLTETRNTSNVNFDVDYLTFKIVDKKVARRTTVQETTLRPVRAYNYVTTIGAKETQFTVLVFPIFTIPNDKYLNFDLHEKNGGRHQNFNIDNDDLVRAREIKEFSIR